MVMRAVPRPLAELEVHLSPMRRRHLRSVLRIEQLVYPRPWTLGLFLSELALRASRHYVVARIDGEVVGYAGLMIAADEAHVTTIAVDPEWQRAKIGTRLLLVMVHEAIARGALGLTLEVRVSNEAAQALYRRFGFVPAGIRKGYYTETNEDALVMWAHDIGAPAYRDRISAIETSVPGATVLHQQ